MADVVAVFWHALHVYAIASMLLLAVLTIVGYVVVWRRVFLHYKRQAPPSEKQLRRLARVAPQLLHRCARRQRNLVRLVTRVETFFVGMAGEPSLNRSAIALVGFVAAARADNVPMAINFLLVAADYHAPCMLDCRLWSAAAFYAACPRWTMETRILAAVAGGTFCPVFAPRAARDGSCEQTGSSAADKRTFCAASASPSNQEDLDYMLAESLQEEEAAAISDDEFSMVEEGAGGISLRARVVETMLFECLPGDWAAQIVSALQSDFGPEEATRLLEADWSRDWNGWRELVGVLQELEPVGELWDVAWLEVTECLRRFVRLADQNGEVPTLTEHQRLQQLASQRGLERGRGEVYGRNDCLTDSLLQVLAHAQLLPALPREDRDVACEQNRAALQFHYNPALRPRQRDAATGADLGECSTAFLQHDVHADEIVRFFLDYVHAALPRAWPPEGVRLNVFSRLDSERIPHSTRVLNAVAGSEAPDITVCLYNSTGVGTSGYHYDPMFGGTPPARNAAPGAGSANANGSDDAVSGGQGEAAGAASSRSASLPDAPGAAVAEGWNASVGGTVPTKRRKLEEGEQFAAAVANAGSSRGAASNLHSVHGAADAAVAERRVSIADGAVLCRKRLPEVGGLSAKGSGDAGCAGHGEAAAAPSGSLASLLDAPGTAVAEGWNTSVGEAVPAKRRKFEAGEQAAAAVANAVGRSTSADGKVGMKSAGACPSAGSSSDTDTGSDSNSGSESDPSQDECYFSVVVEANRGAVSEQDCLQQRCEALAVEHLRQRPTLPALREDGTVSWTDTDSGIRIPIFSCPFRDCHYATDNREEFLLHVAGPAENSPHHGTIERVCGTDMKFVRRIDYVLGAIGHWERSQWPLLGLAVPRRTLRTLALSYNDDAIKCLVCFVCAEQRTTFAGPAHPDYEGVRNGSDSCARGLVCVRHFFSPEADFRRGGFLWSPT